MLDVNSEKVPEEQEKSDSIQSDCTVDQRGRQKGRKKCSPSPQSEHKYNLHERKKSIDTENSDKSSIVDTGQIPKTKESNKTSELGNKTNSKILQELGSESDSLESKSESSSDEEKVDIFKRRENNISYSKNHIFAGKDNIIFFATSDLSGKSGIVNVLVEKRYLNKDKFLSKKFAKNEIVHLQKNKRHFLGIICKTDNRDYVNLSDIRKHSEKLKTELDELGIPSFRISRDPKILDESIWRKLKDFLREKFHDFEIEITICEDILPIAPVQKRLDIIREYHNSALAGHRGGNSTYKKILKKFYWCGLKSDVVQYVRHCQDC